MFPGGPAPPYVNNLASLAGGSPNGNWNLFMIDDEGGFFGFAIDGWGLKLEVDPPPSAPQPPVNTARPNLTGKAKAGKTLTCEPGGWTGASSFAFAWLRNGDPLANETAATLELKRRYAGKAIQCKVTATGAGGSAARKSRPVVPKKPRR